MNAPRPVPSTWPAPEPNFEPNSELGAQHTRADHAEAEAVKQRYARRELADARYSLLRPEVLYSLQERQRAMRAGWAAWGREMAELHALEVGCGAGQNLLDCVRMGMAPEHLIGLELLPERVAQARQRLPAAVQLFQGDALHAPVPAASQDMVMQFTVFSSLLDEAFQHLLAQAMWGWLKPGGRLLWYDVIYNNPRNPDVRGVPMRRIRALFPQGHCHGHKLTLAPPLARPLCRLHPLLYPVFNSLPFLRTHVLVWIEKPAA